MPEHFSRAEAASANLQRFGHLPNVVHKRGNETDHNRARQIHAERQAQPLQRGEQRLNAGSERQRQYHVQHDRAAQKRHHKAFRRKRHAGNSAGHAPRTCGGNAHHEREGRIGHGQRAKTAHGQRVGQRCGKQHRLPLEGADDNRRRRRQQRDDHAGAHVEPALRGSLLIRQKTFQFHGRRPLRGGCKAFAFRDARPPTDE